MEQGSAGQTTGQVEKYYDEFRLQQQNLGVNVRHREIWRNLRKLGLNDRSNVLEIGCGIGTVSSLILRTVKRGRFVGADISGESLKVARALNSRSQNAIFVQTDMSDFASDIRFDFVVFPDVLEHIPVEQHETIFRRVAQYCAPAAQALINIPEPNFLNWIRKHQPEKLQIIDQSLSLARLAMDAQNAGFHLHSVTPYKLFYEVCDYVSIVMKRMAEVEEVRVAGKFVRLTRNAISRLR
jgi:2-polyprenyl-3-methyl-5-hydroxy-6-metoxy-1,4-benzoquinol methylase